MNLHRNGTYSKVLANQNDYHTLAFKSKKCEENLAQKTLLLSKRDEQIKGLEGKIERLTRGIINRQVKL